MAVLPDDLSSALDDELARHPVARLTQSVDRLSARYRQGDAATSPILGSEADLVTLSYVLGELPDATRADVVRWLAAKPGAVALIEPGTPAGYERIRAARAQLIDLGLHVVAPCPHDAACPIVPGEDWCHFAARLPRSGLHRKLKAGTLGFEDEKFAYVVASRTAPERPDARIIRHPKKHKGWVALDLCTPDGLKPAVAVSKKQGPRYRAARDAEWGDGWSSA